MPHKRNRTKLDAELDARLAKMCWLSDGEFYTSEEIAAFCNTTRQSIERITRRAMTKLALHPLARKLLLDYTDAVGDDYVLGVRKRVLKAARTRASKLKLKAA